MQRNKADRWSPCTAIVLCIGLIVAASCTSESSQPAATTQPPRPAAGPGAFAEPVELTAAGGVLEVTLRAHQSAVSLDTVATPLQDALVFGFDVLKGTSSTGQRHADATYPAPTLHVDPGETLIVHLENAMSGLTIADFLDPAFTKTGQTVPRYPEPLTSAPFNLHTHGLHVSPKGNSDNVLLDVPAGMSNTYQYDIPTDHPQGLYWYHSHRQVWERTGAFNISVFPYTLIKTRDSYSFIAGFSDVNWTGLTNIMGRPELKDRFPTVRDRTAADKQPAIHQELEAWSAGLTSQEVLDRVMDYMLNKRGPGTVATARVNSPQDTLGESHWWERGVFQRVEDPHYGTLLLQAPPWKMSRTPPRLKWACRPVGADNAAIFTRYLGLPPSELADLRARGAV